MAANRARQEPLPMPDSTVEPDSTRHLNASPSYHRVPRIRRPIPSHCNSWSLHCIKEAADPEAGYEPSAPARCPKCSNIDSLYFCRECEMKGCLPCLKQKKKHYSVCMSDGDFKPYVDPKKFTELFDEVNEFIHQNMDEEIRKLNQQADMCRLYFDTVFTQLKKDYEKKDMDIAQFNRLKEAYSVFCTKRATFLGETNGVYRDALRLHPFYDLVRNFQNPNRIFDGIL
ncbi:hypothetical protein QR680_003020 [Steinernema hermaphroditum]|uniref:Uncharacterized protein n=1 Tax=Steinernema hermaphroditum TaxID=289476 RepID=A0AA39H631_9BILA|nr:hypothetical protein QR680_003020 [Steinernema hermaphroditum]